ncbi:XRE family transcriptional regulator [Pilimelia anulata]|uniref:XRE family transcriptional regulator n=1 Tax=Pilimelia anulata TaxID=53371 RepID=A0A8J3AZW4_9ACTN|nr:XRE family transcriptional regulator [Pilimelia anulata]GGJ78412.1 XRE family transcriptional regulator [Pilimelia anulata]
MVKEEAGRVLAENLRALRQRRGMSLSALARHSGIAKGTLSQLESGSGNPTIETVFSLSNALGVPVSDLLTAPVGAEVILVRGADLDVLSSNAVDLRLARRLDLRGTTIEVYDQRVRPPAVQHSAGHPGREHVLVTAGVLRAGPADAPHELRAGDYLSFPAGGPHVYQAVGGPVASVLLLEYDTDDDLPPAPHAARPAPRAD